MARRPGFGGFVGERRLTDAQIATIAAWVKQGMPRGDERRMPKLPEFPADGWQLGTPDLVLEMPAGFDVRATGPDMFRNFVIPTRLTEDKWVRAIEFRPAARKVVHHAIFAAVPGGSLAAIDGTDGRPASAGWARSASPAAASRRGLADGRLARRRTCFRRVSRRDFRRDRISCCRCTSTRAASRRQRSR